MKPSHSDDKEDVWRWMRQVEDAGPWQWRIILERHMYLQHLLHQWWHHVKVEVFWHFLTFFDVIQCHRGKYWLNVYLKPATRNSYCLLRMAYTPVVLAAQKSKISFVHIYKYCTLHQPLQCPPNHHTLSEMQIIQSHMSTRC